MANYIPDNRYSSDYKLEPMSLLQQPSFSSSHGPAFDRSTSRPISEYSRTESTRRLFNKIDEHFIGPRDLDRHSKLPYFIRIHGSILPKMIVPLLVVGVWSTIVTCFCKFLTTSPVGVPSILLSVLGFVVGLALTFRSTSAYERYSDGRKLWATVSVQSRNLARYIWINITERSDYEKEDILAKLTGINLILAFALALKHKLRFEPYQHYPDIAYLTSHLDTFARAASFTPEAHFTTPKSRWKRVGEFLGLSLATSNPRKTIKRATQPLGNLPLEIIMYISTYIEDCFKKDTIKSPMVLAQILTSIAALSDAQAGAERVLSTPIPLSYNILIAQIVLIYVYLLPFQLYNSWGWATIPGTMASAYIMIGLLAISYELENPFGYDVNDLPLDMYCEQLRQDLDVITATPPAKFDKSWKGGNDEATKNNPWPLSSSGVDNWDEKSIADIRRALKAKV
ncbi:Bestrophin, RFP-TM, chloride channel-domain-containing protein, partial [Xylogone sp. PMI_703]